MIPLSGYISEKFASCAAVGAEKHIGFDERAAKKKKIKSENTNVKHLKILAAPGSSALKSQEEIKCSTKWVSMSS